LIVPFSLVTTTSVRVSWFRSATATPEVPSGDPSVIGRLLHTDDDATVSTLQMRGLAPTFHPVKTTLACVGVASAAGELPVNGVMPVRATARSAKTNARRRWLRTAWDDGVVSRRAAGIEGCYRHPVSVS
jgi:hypothetical protein